MRERLFKSFFSGGFECSTHLLPDGTRRDLLNSTQHLRFVRQDYQRLIDHGISTIRSGLRWYAIDNGTGALDFSSVLPQIRAAHEMGIQVIWDLCHFGFPDDVDAFSPQFIDRFERLARGFARLLREETDAQPFICPINEISFLSWAGGDAGFFNPFVNGRGFELKRQFAQAAICAIEAIWNEVPQARIVHADPIIYIMNDPSRPHEAAEAEGNRLAQYQGWDMLTGRLAPEIGGHERYLDIIGVNYYPANQWYLRGDTITPADPNHRPFRDMLNEVYERYCRPMFIAETGAEGEIRPEWLRLVCDEVDAAIRAEIPIHGICLYPIVNFPGWADERHCHNGLWDYADAQGNRAIYEPLSEELQSQQERFRQHGF